MIATTMEPTDARRLLPSWDEPSFRARSGNSSMARSSAHRSSISTRARPSTVRHKYSNTTGADLWAALEKLLAIRSRTAGVSPSMIDFVMNVAGRNADGATVAASEHIDQAWAFAVANRDKLMKDQDAIGQNKAFSDIVASSSDPDVAARRVGNGIRLRAAQKAACCRKCAPH
ncbi:hypothetical protein [Massilia psychrophila]|uniref:hypothetical protein n=1 Tax=Massilia psychrophila TaxID=1603353 RepID=UPI00117CCF74|nr:hypothetical protein [Massilia psychrophila]